MSDNLTAKELWLADYSNRICADCYRQVKSECLI